MIIKIAYFCELVLNLFALVTIYNLPGSIQNFDSSKDFYINQQII